MLTERLLYQSISNKVFIMSLLKEQQFIDPMKRLIAIIPKRVYHKHLHGGKVGNIAYYHLMYDQTQQAIKFSLCLQISFLRGRLRQKT